MRKTILPVLAAALTAATLAGCEQSAVPASTTVVKEPVVVKEKETVREVPPATSSTTIVQPAAPAPQATETSRSRETTRVDTPSGSVTRTQTDSTKTTQ